MREYVYCRKSFIVYNIDSEYLCLSKVVTDLQGQRQIRLSFRSHSIKLTLEPSRQPLNVRITPKRLKSFPQPRQILHLPSVSHYLSHSASIKHTINIIEHFYKLQSRHVTVCADAHRLYMSLSDLLADELRMSQTRPGDRKMVAVDVNEFIRTRDAVSRACLLLASRAPHYQRPTMQQPRYRHFTHSFLSSRRRYHL